MLERRVPTSAPIAGDAERQGQVHAAATPLAGPVDMTGVLDAASLDRLRELDPHGQSRLVERVLQTYLGSLDRLLPKLDEARRTEDWTGIRQVAHTLKSSSASIGALAMSELCAAIEKSVREEQVASLPALLSGMDAELDRVRTALQCMVGAGKA